MANYEKVTRELIATYLNITPKENSETYAIVGVGITDYGQDYNPQRTTEKWIIHKNATTTTDSYQIQADASQTCYKGDEVYDYVNDIRRYAKVGADTETQVLDIDLYDSEVVNGVTQYKATKYEATVAITSYAKGEIPKLEYSIAYNGDPIVGTVVIENQRPVFTADAEQSA